MGHSCGTLIRDTIVGHSIWDSLVGHTLRGCKTSVSYETASKSHTSSLQNERFVRDFLQISHVKSPKRAFRPRLPPKRAFRTRLPPKVKRKHPSEHTHHAALPSRFAIPAPPNNTRSHANPNVYHNSQPHDSLRLPRIFPRPHV